MSILVFLTLNNMKTKTAIFPGSFDPFTKGHEYVVRKALDVFDEVIIGIGINTSKQYLFDLEKKNCAYSRNL
jgi:pantetheine-phosphate adenylyltransferase